MSTPLKTFLKTLSTRWNSHLSRRIAFWIFSGIVTIESIILVPSVYRREQELLAQLREITLGKVTWILITYPNISDAELLTQLQKLQNSNSLIQGGAVYQASGQFIGTFGNLPQLSLTQLGNNRPQRQGNFYDDIVWSGSQMKTNHTVIIRHDASSVQPELIAYIARITGLVVIISLFLTLTVWITLDPIVITPILRLRQDLLRAGEAIYNDETPPNFSSILFKRQDELGDVMTAFQEMFGLITEATNARKQALTALDNELEKGRIMQKNFLPRQLLEKSGWEIAAFMSPARRVAGDFYDVFELPENHIVLVIGDVCDKGVSAGLFMGLFRSLIRIFSHQCCHHHSIAENALQAVSMTNDYIAENHGDEGMFATLFMGILDLATGTLTYINGGHEPLLIINPEGKIRETLEPTGTAVGMLPDMEFNSEKKTLNSEEILLGFTDGVTEARNLERAFFGQANVLEVLQHPYNSAEVMLETLKSKVLAHIGDAEQSDDITLLAIRRQP
jgi:serine phosphatase RsbU (regulator of sigma subunit)